jgi:hypothetical protein
MNYYLDGDSNQLRLEICSLQKSQSETISCNQELKKAMQTKETNLFCLGVIM